MPDAEYIYLSQFLRQMMVKYAQLKTADVQLSKPAATGTVKQADVQLSKPAATGTVKQADARISTLSRSIVIKPA